MAKKPDAKPRPKPTPPPQPTRTTDDDQPLTTRSGLSIGTASGKPLVGDLR